VTLNSNYLRGGITLPEGKKPGRKKDKAALLGVKQVCVRESEEAMLNKT